MEGILRKSWFRILIGIFLIGIVTRFIYFPGNIYFGYDQARDSFVSQQILAGKLKIIGPPSSFNSNLFHGPLIYYIYAPIYFLAGGSPEAIASVLKIYNALGIFLVFLLGKILFNKRVGLVACLIFAVSFEQSQYTLFISHPSWAIIPVLFFYLGLAWYFIKNKPYGLILAAGSLGLAVQFHYSNILLLLPLVFILLLKGTFPPLKTTLLSVGVFILSISSFIVAEYKFGFRMSRSVLTFSGTSGMADLLSAKSLQSLGLVNFRFIHDNFFFDQRLIVIFVAIIILGVFYFIKTKQYLKQLFFLLLWFFTGQIVYLFSHSSSYYYSVGASVSLIFLTALLVNLISRKSLFLAILPMVLIISSNLYLTSQFSQKGPNEDFVVQPGLILIQEKIALDYIYHSSEGKPFAVNAVTIPAYVNTTWSYLFDWYGREKYHSLPVWGGSVAEGFENVLVINNNRASLPENQYLIIEPKTDLNPEFYKDFLNNENYFSKVVEQRNFGTFFVQKRLKI